MLKNTERKWYEDAFLSLLFLILGILIWCNGFSGIANKFLTGEELTKPSKAKGLLAMVAFLENTNWKYLIICFFFLSSFLAGKIALKKYKLNGG